MTPARWFWQALALIGVLAADAIRRPEPVHGYTSSEFWSDNPANQARSTNPRQQHG